MKKINIKVIIYSIIALGCLALTFLIDWLFIVPAAILMYLNQRELMKPESKRKFKSPE
jgi:membrane protein CcdC involved in cytochrome C biogenesis